MKITSSSQHFIVAVLALIALVALQITGHGSTDLTGVLCTIIGASGYGGALTRESPEQKP